MLWRAIEHFMPTSVHQAELTSTWNIENFVLCYFKLLS